MTTAHKDTMIYVCPERDIECGSRQDKWCEACPRRAANTAHKDLPALPTMMKAFVTSESDGAGRYSLQFKFQTIADMHRAHDEWRTFCAALARPEPASAPVAVESENAAFLAELQEQYDEQNDAFQFTSLKLVDAEKEVERLKDELLAAQFGIAVAGPATPQGQQSAGAGFSPSGYQCQKCGEMSWRHPYRNCDEPIKEPI